MVKAIKLLLLVLLVAVIGVFAWGYAPDREIAELRAEYGGEPSQILPLPNGQQVHIRDEGPRQAPVLVLLHGSSSSLHTWQGWTEALDDQYRIVRLDLPGHGLTGPQINDDYTAKAYSDTVALTMAQLGVDKYIVAGNSMGGWVAWNHALAYPDKVTGLILVDAGGAPDAAPTSLPIGFRLAQNKTLRPVLQWFTPRMMVDRSVRQSVADPTKVTDAQVDRYYDLLRYPGNREATSLRGDVARVPATAIQMAQIGIPALVIWGRQDTLIPVTAADWFDENLPRSSKIIYPNLGHLPMEEAPAQTAEDVRQWLKDVGLNEKIAGPSPLPFIAPTKAPPQTAPAQDNP